MPTIPNVLQTGGLDRSSETMQTLVTAKGVRLERIVSHGQASPEGAWYDQTEDEWVAVISGRAGLRLEGEPIDRTLGPGDAIYLPAGCRHRVTWTDPSEPTIWLALFIDPELAPKPDTGESS